MTDMTEVTLIDSATLAVQHERLVSSVTIEPPPLSINLGDVGVLFERDGELHFEGKAAPSADVLMEFLRGFYNSEVAALRRELKKARQNEREALRQLGMMRGG